MYIVSPGVYAPLFTDMDCLRIPDGQQKHVVMSSSRFWVTVSVKSGRWPMLALTTSSLSQSICGRVSLSLSSATLLVLVLFHPQIQYSISTLARCACAPTRITTTTRTTTRRKGAQALQFPLQPGSTSCILDLLKYRLWLPLPLSPPTRVTLIL